MRRSGCALVVLIGLLGVPACRDQSPSRAAVVTASSRGRSSPETFFAVRNHATELVEVEVATGRVRRTVLDVGPYREPAPTDDIDPNRTIDGMAIDPGRRVLFYSQGPEPAVGALYRKVLPDGSPERIGDGRGPSVSPDGRWLAFVNGSLLQIRDLATGEGRLFEEAVGEFGGDDTAWASDSITLAFEAEGAEAMSIRTMNTETGAVMHPRPAGSESASPYFASSPRFRPSDGLLGVVCCRDPNATGDDRPPGRTFILHDPQTGEEHHRFTLPFTAAVCAFDPTGSELLFTTSPEGRVYRYRDGTFTRISGLVDVSNVVW